jgi:hypothetical protein
MKKDEAEKFHIRCLEATVQNQGCPPSY